jgi:hypothetical protein
MYADKIKELANDIMKLITDKEYYTAKRVEALDIRKN